MPAQLRAIYVKRFKKGPMDPRGAATLVAGKGIAILTLLALSAPAARAEELPEETQVKAICATVAGFEPGPNARPTHEDRRAFAAKSEDCLDYVYGYSHPEKLDLDKGRRCCLAQGDCNRDLAMIFANGWGTPRDYAAATYFLCKTGGEIGIFEQSSMLEHLQAMRSAASPKDLDYCDSVTSGHGAAWCEGLAINRRRPEWEKRIAAVGKTINAPARKALAGLTKAADNFLNQEAVLDNEDSRGGTGHPSFILSRVEVLNDAFVATLERLSRERAPAATPKALRAADQALNQIYQERLEDPVCSGCDEPAATARAVLRDAQRSWIRYRDAWKAFYRLRWQGAAPPEALDREIDTLLTQERVEALRQLAVEP